MTETEMTPQSSFTWAIVEDHKTFCQLLELALEQRSIGHCVATCFSIAEALEKLPPVHPDVVIMDWTYEKEQVTGEFLLSQLRPKLPKTKWLVLTAKTTTSVLQTALKYGASGFVGKTAEASEVAAAVQHLAEGGKNYYCKKSQELLTRLHTGEAATNLTDKELAIVRLVARGDEMKVVAANLDMADKTLRNHMVDIRAKTKTGNNVQLAAYAREHGISATD